ncbi:MAG: thermonuclease family protein [Hyphomonadaceae bacterium]|nr:thermonuclease family protein [Hyphomonadaceae bacterium]
MARWAFCVAVFLCFACSAPSPLPDMQAGETGRVTRVIDGDAIVLDTGLSVRLVSILAPAMYPRDGAPEPYAGESARVLEDLTLGRRVQLFYPGLTRDRYDRALAHVVTIDGAGPKLWLNQAMIVRGAARVRLYPSTAARGQDLLALEAAARETREGLWRERAYAVQDAATLAPETDGFVLVSATLGPARPLAPNQPFPPACFRTLAESDLIVSVRRAAASTCGLDVGTRVLIRGWVSEGEIDLTHPWHVEILSEN